MVTEFRDTDPRTDTQLRDPTALVLTQRVVKAVQALFEHTGASYLLLQVPNTEPPHFVVAGQFDSIESLLRVHRLESRH